MHDSPAEQSLSVPAQSPSLSSDLSGQMQDSPSFLPDVLPLLPEELLELDELLEPPGQRSWKLEALPSSAQLFAARQSS